MAGPIYALINGLRFGLLLVPRQRYPLPTATAFWCAALLSVLADFVLNLGLVSAPEEFDLAGLTDSAFEILKPLLLAWLLSLLARRPALLWGLATWMLIVGVVIRVVAGAVIARDPQFDHTWIVFSAPHFAIAFGVWMLLAGYRIWHWLEPNWRWLRLVAFALGAAVPQALIYRAVPYHLDYFFTAEPDYSAPVTNALWPEEVHAETLFAEQSDKLDRALQALEPQRPGQVDLYLLAVGSYASEDVFRNEVNYVQALFDQRMGTQGRSLVLLNHFDALRDRPLATQRNIDRALTGIAKRIDLDEDLVFLFVTTHGSEAHELSVELAGFPLQQITPESLSRSIRDAGIRWRVTTISACYSGGYVEALSASTALVLTASRRDRTSFGCGADSDITFFGRAYFAEALNQSVDFIAAFEIAKDAIALREAAIDGEPSEPQIASTELIEAKLAQWRSQLKPGPPLAFTPPK